MHIMGSVFPAATSIRLDRSDRATWPVTVNVCGPDPTSSLGVHLTDAGARGLLAQLTAALDDLTAAAGVDEDADDEVSA